jgi:hypothetical protein
MGGLALCVRCQRCRHKITQRRHTPLLMLTMCKCCLLLLLLLLLLL